MRIKIIRIIIIGLFCVVTMGLGYTQLLRGQYYYLLSRNNRIRIVPVEGRRGRILDRNGKILAGSRVSFDVVVIPQELGDMNRLFAYLAKILETTPEELEKTYRRKKLATFAPITIASDVPMDKAIQIEENKFLFNGLLIRAGSRREYPYGPVGAHLIGYVGKINRSKQTRLKEYGYSAQDILGYSGVEEYYDSYLNGENGGLQIEVNSRGEQVQLLGAKEPVRGQDIQLTVDAGIQSMAAEALGEKRGAIVIIDFENGEVLALVSSPSFDPNKFIEEDRRVISGYFTDENAPLLNRAISGQFPPGSVFKIVMALGGLDAGKIRPEITFNCPGYYQLGRRRFRCTHAHGVQNLTEGIAHSCNVYFYNTGLNMGPDLIIRYAELFGLGRQTGIDLPYEMAGNVPDRRQRRAATGRGWYEGDTLNLSIGQGDMLTTPIQIAMVMAKVARNGRELQPHVLKNVSGRQQPVEHVFTQTIDINQRHFDTVQAGMRAAVGDYSGTAHLADSSGVTIYGKTGTAQSSKGKLSHAWFAGFCPQAKKKIAFCVFLEHGGSSYNAVRIARDLFLRMKENNYL